MAANRGWPYSEVSLAQSDPRRFLRVATTHQRRFAASRPAAGNPAFLRSCPGLRPVSDRFLFLHAGDLARGANGSWWVLGDRTQAPSGVGYSLENRLVLSQVFP